MESIETIDGQKQKHRHLRAQLSFLYRADGSCSLEQGDTVIWSCVNGPGDVGSSKRLDDRLYIEVVYRYGRGNRISNKPNRMLSSVVEQTVDVIRYPRAALTVTVQELQPEGSELASALTCTCLSLLDSGIMMNGVFCGVCVAVIGDRLVLDPDRKASKEADAVFTFAFMSSQATWPVNPVRLIACDTDGTFDLGSFEAASKLACDATADIFLFFKETLQRKLSANLR